MVSRPERRVEEVSKILFERRKIHDCLGFVCFGCQVFAACYQAGDIRREEGKKQAPPQSQGVAAFVLNKICETYRL